MTEFMKDDLINVLLDNIDEKVIFDTLTLRFYDEIYREERRQSHVKKAMDHFNTLKEAFDTILKNKDYMLIYHRVMDIKEMIDNTIEGYFKEKEEEAIERIMDSNKISLSQIEDLKEQEGLKDYDIYKEDIKENFLSQNARELYDTGKALLLENKNHVTLSEEDIMMEVIKATDIDYLIQQLAQEFTEIIDNRDRYHLVMDDEELDDSGEGILMEEGKFSIDNYYDIYPFLYEYTGERVSYLATENEGTEDFSYWVTYEEHFEKILREMLVSNFSRVLEELANSRYSDYSLLMDKLNIKESNYHDVQKILQQSPTLYYELNEFQEKIWGKFIQSEAKELYKLGIKGS